MFSHKESQGDTILEKNMARATKERNLRYGLIPRLPSFPKWRQGWPLSLSRGLGDPLTSFPPQALGTPHLVLFPGYGGHLSLVEGGLYIIRVLYKEYRLEFVAM